MRPKCDSDRAAFGGRLCRTLPSVLCCAVLLLGCRHNSTEARLAASLEEARRDAARSGRGVRRAILRAAGDVLQGLEPRDLRKPVPIAAFLIRGQESLILTVAWAQIEPNLSEVMVLQGGGDPGAPLRLTVPVEYVEENARAAQNYVHYSASWRWPTGDCPLRFHTEGTASVAFLDADGALSEAVVLMEVSDPGDWHQLAR